MSIVLLLHMPVVFRMQMAIVLSSASLRPICTSENAEHSCGERVVGKCLKEVTNPALHVVVVPPPFKKSTPLIIFCQMMCLFWEGSPYYSRNITVVPINKL